MANQTGIEMNVSKSGRGVDNLFTMVVDDSLADRFIAGKLLSRAIVDGSQKIFESAVSAWEYLSGLNGSETLPDVILLDIRMPEMDGFEFLDNFQTLPEMIRKGVRVFMLTSSVNPDDRAKAETYASVVGFISKPLTESALKEALSGTEQA